MPPVPTTRSERRSKFKRDLAKELRRNATEPERRLWSLLRGKLVIELDGEQHAKGSAPAYDEARTKFLEGRGYRVLRITNADLMKNRDNVSEAIWVPVKSSGLPLPEPPSAVRPSLKGRVG
jgi:very-short-patch-repair endonuclease